MNPRGKKIRDPYYLRWVKEQGGVCCLCLRLYGETRPVEELHHFGPKGMGQRSHDYEVARLCRRCHGEQQGKRRVAYMRRNEMHILEALTRDALDLLIGYVHEVKHGKSLRT